MKTIANLIVLTSMFIGQFSGPYAPQSISSKNTPTATQTLVATATATGGLDKGTPTETITPIPSETATPVPSSTEIPPAETVPPVEPAIAINLNATPGFVTPGGHITIDWVIEGISSADHELFLNIILPKGFTPTDKDIKFDEATLMLSIPVLKESGQFKIQADQITEDAVLLASLLEKETILAEVSLVLATKDQFKMDSKGGEIQDSEGKIKLSFPENTFADEAVVQIGEPSGDDVPTFSLSGHPFSIKAQDKNSKANLHLFEKEIEIEVNFANLNIPENQESELYLYWYNPETKLWEGMMSSVDRTSKTIRTLTNHFSVFDVGINNWQSNHVPTVDAFQVPQFTGAGTFSLPIEVPAGPGGLQPSLSLSYNSQVVDQAYFDPTPGKTNTTLAPWVGMGWSLDTSYIERDTHGTDLVDFDDTFLLSVGGISTRVAKGANNTYHALDENFWRIVYDTPTNTWTVWDKTGNIYYFGDVVGEIVGATSLTTNREDTNWGQFQDYAWRWSLRRAKNIYGQELKYTYYEETKTLTAPHDTTVTDTAVYPATIVYPNERYRIYFERFGYQESGTRKDYYIEWATDGIYHQFEQSRLKAIRIQQDTGNDGIFETEIRRYEFRYAADDATNNIIFPTYTFSAGGKMTTLLGVKQYGLNNTSLPEHTFTYEDNTHLTNASNGHGGGVHFTYDNWYPLLNTNAPITNEVHFGTSGQPCRLVYNTTSPWVGNAYCDSEIDDHGRRVYFMMVNGTIYSDGTQHYADGHNDRQFMRPGRAYKFTVIYEPKPGGMVQVGLNNGSADFFGDLSSTGTATAIVTLPYGSTDLRPLIRTTGVAIKIQSFKMEALPTFSRVIVKRLSDGNNHNYDYTYTYSGAAVNDALHSDMANSCPPNASNCYEYLGENSEFRGNASVIEIGPDSRKVITEFWQDDAKKGRPKSIQTVNMSSGALLSQTIYTYAQTEQATVMSSDDYHLKIYWVYPDSTETRIYTNNGASSARTNIVYEYEAIYGNLTAQTDQIWNGSGWNTYRSTSTYYSQNVSPTRYLVSLPGGQNVFNGSNTLIAQTLYVYDNKTTLNTAPDDGKLTATLQWVDGSKYKSTSYGYDTWGNQTSVTVYSDYGTPWAASGARTTTTTYDPIYNTYPVAIVNPLFQTTSLIYDYTKGVPLSETDPNGATTSATYDVFGRIITLTKPGDSAPTLTMTYNDTGMASVSSFITTITQRVDVSNTYAITRVYDGMGRQTKITSGGMTVDTVYESPTVTKQSVPYVGISPNLFTQTTIDLNARTVTTTAPDRTSSVTQADGLLTTVTDARGNKTATLTDVWGRTAWVKPKDAQGLPFGPYVEYTYDPLDRMLTAVRGGSTTTLAYDNAGRKKTMTDPDMGYWSYEYDALGNLTQQVDAKGQVTCLYYDNLNRLKGKNYQTTPCPSADPGTTHYTVENFYDAGAYGKGRRTGMTDTSGATSWAYDARGRVKSETKNITGVTYATQWGYNSADLTTTTTYPDGEVVTNTYDPRMLLNSVAGTNSYVNSTAYDSAGRMTKRIYGNTTVTNYSYYPWDTANQGGLLSSVSANESRLQNLAYTYDKNGNVLTITDALAGPQTQTFTYDALNRIKTASATGGTNGLYSESYDYDSTSGNLSKKNWLDYTYGDSAHVHAVTSLINGNSYNYDANGNMITRSISTDPVTSTGQVFDLVYDVGNRLTSVDAHTVTNIIAPIFVDVLGGVGGNPYKPEIEAIYKAGITSGCATNPMRYCPTAIVTRDQMAVFLLRAKHGRNYVPPAVGTSTGFLDVPINHWAAAWIKQLAAEGITSGCGGGNYCPSANVTRDQFAIFVLRAKGIWSVPAYTAYSYTDISASPFKNYIQYLASQLGIIDYYPSTGLYSPSGSLTRERLAYLLVRVFNLQLASAPRPSVPAESLAAAPQATRSAPAQDILTSMRALPPLPAFFGTKVLAMPALDIVSSAGDPVASFVYDGDGRRVKSVVGGVTTYFVNDLYEVTINGATTITKYYFAGTQRIAMRKGGVLTYMLSDHLGSTSLTTSNTGAVISELRYTAWGEVRYQAGTTSTGYTYTGQYSNVSDFGLMFYNARWYDPYLNHFTQPDSIVPDPYNSQDYDRYAYARNNPIRYTDPSGHDPSNNNCDYAGVGCSNTVFHSFDGGWNYPQYSTWNLLRKGSACAACHVTHWTGKIPTNDEISLTQVRGWRSFDKLALPVHAGGLGAIAAMQAEAIAAVEQSGGIQLYRGLSNDHPQLGTYLETGEVQPRGGAASVYEHVMGNTQSNYTSWTTNIEVAEGFAGPNGKILTVNTAEIPNTTIPTYEWSPFDEFEILIEGIIKGANSLP